MSILYFKELFIRRSFNSFSYKLLVLYWLSLNDTDFCTSKLFVQLKVQIDAHVFICILLSSLLLALHVSGAICTHPQEHNLQRRAIGVCNVFGM
jgi:hypothetical protein